MATVCLISSDFEGGVNILDEHSADLDAQNVLQYDTISSGRFLVALRYDRLQS